MAKHRPDIVFFENIQETGGGEGNNGYGGSHLEILKQQWAEEGYECQVIHTDSFKFGLPHHRRRIIIVAFNTRDPTLFTFAERDVDRVFHTLRCLIPLCYRTADCATKYMLPYEDKRVNAELVLATADAVTRIDKGFDIAKTMAVCEQYGIPFGTFHVSRWPNLHASPWYSTLSSRQKLSICFSMAQHNDSRIVFRDLQQNGINCLGRGRHVGINNAGRGYGYRRRRDRVA